jgi:hypothetical protein
MLRLNALHFCCGKIFVRDYQVPGSDSLSSKHSSPFALPGTRYQVLKVSSFDTYKESLVLHFA